MHDELFGSRRRALEEEFFRRQNEELLASMRAKSEAQHVRATLRTTTGITDESLLEHLVAAGMTAATIVAAALVPVLAVAWADGQLEDAERAEILRGATAEESAEPARTLLSGWLSVEPEPALFATWTEYLKDLLPRLEPQARETPAQRLSPARKPSPKRREGGRTASDAGRERKNTPSCRRSKPRLPFGDSRS